MKRIILLLEIALVGAILIACASKVAPVAPLKEKPLEVVAPAAKADWEVKWEKALEGARKEGNVVVYGGSVAANLKDAAKMFKEKFGINLEALTGRGADITAKISSERRGGLFIPDVYASGPTDIYTALKPMGAVDPLEPVLILPEVIDPKGWLDEKHYWGDYDRMVYLWAADVDVPIAINTNMIQPSEIKAYQDLFNPKWKGKIVLNDATVAGTGLRSFVDSIYNKILEPDFYRNLVKYQDIAVQRDQVLLNVWLVRGKYPIVLWPSWGRMSEYIEAGAPVGSVIPKEGSMVRSGGAALSIMNKAPHPNATAVLVNWFLSREGQAFIQVKAAKQSRRIDITTEGLMHFRQPGVKYFSSPLDEEKFTLEEVPKYTQLAVEIFGPVLGR